jgi:hypothetical protein
MTTEFDIFVAYKEAEKEITGKGFRLTKNWDSYSKRSISKTDMAYLTRLKGFFKTKWLSIDILEYMKCGWELYKLTNSKLCPECGVTLHQPNKNFHECMECGYDLRKGFTLNKILRPKIMKYYIEKDKIRKRNLSPSQKSIDKSFEFINNYMKDITVPDGYTTLQMYCKIKDGDMKTIISHYLKGKVDSMTFVYSMYYKYIKLTDVERESCYNVVNRYRDFLEKMFKVEQYIRDKENELGNTTLL